MSCNRERRFELPGTQELSTDQDAALELPLEGQHLIIGGPGTGKSVVALLRARRLARNKKDYIFLIYNHVLNQSNMHLFGSDSPLQSRTWRSWFYKLWRQVFRSSVPTLASDRGGGYRSIDWEMVVQTIQDPPEHARLPTNHPYLVIDEGQDMPPGFYQALINLGFENFYVVADQNQQITDECSARTDIESILCIDTNSTLELKKNYRNTHAIAALAQHFYPDDPSSPRPELPQPTSSVITPKLVSYDKLNPRWSCEFIITRMLQLSDRQPRKSIAIIVADNFLRSQFFDELKSLSIKLELDCGPPPIQTYRSREEQNLNFGTGGIMVFNAQSCKGLEFDIVFIADIDKYWAKEEKQLKARFYIMVARAREQVFFLRRGPIDWSVENILPEDENFLVRS